MSKRFDGQVVWITGGGTGLGREMAKEFARQGAKVAVSGRRLEPLERAVAEVETLQGEALAVSCDVNDEESVAAAIKKVVSTWGKIDVSVANAGFGVGGRFESLSTADWRRQFETNVLGAVTTARLALPELHKTKGRLVLIGSVAGLVSSPGTAPYSASKSAIRTLGQVLAMELYGSGVSCTTIHPGFVKSDIARVDNDGEFHADRDDPRPAALMWETDRAARVMVKAIYKRRTEFVFTWHGVAGAWLGRHTPGLVQFLLSRFGGGYRPPKNP